MSRKLFGLLTATGLSFAAAAMPAQANNIVGSFTTVPQVWLGPVAQPIRLSPAGALAIPFVNPIPGPVSVTYTAECQLNGPSSSWLHLTIVIDGLIILPSGPDAAFCAGQGVGVATGWARHSITVSRLLGAGAHTLSVRGQVTGAHAGARLDDTSIVIAR